MAPLARVSLDKASPARYMKTLQTKTGRHRGASLDDYAPGRLVREIVRFSRNPKKFLFVAGDVAAVLLANLLAITLRFDFDWSAVTARSYRNLDLLLLDLLVTPLVFQVSGLYLGVWKYTGLEDLVRLAKAVGYRVVVLVLVFYSLGFYGLSRAVLIIGTVLLGVFSGLLRLAPRVRSELLASKRHGIGPRALIIGAGDTGESLLRELRKAPHMDFTPIGFIDRDREKAGVKIHGVPVLGGLGDLERLIAGHGVREVIAAIPDASSRDMREIFEICRRTGSRLRTVPTRGEVARGAARISQIRLVELEDLLGREVINLDRQLLLQSLSGHRILITGAAGSIGSEMARQIAGYDPGSLILLDRNENNLFYLEADLRAAHPFLQLRAAVGDVLDQASLRRLFRDERPQVVFHAAAYKHVPLMEHNPVEAVKNNVLATRRLARIAAEAGVERLIYVSTDKAVHPESVMGATKRLGECLVKSESNARTRFMAVRFGNVLGSDGSVVPTFRKQIAAGGPVTVTHPEATRYFMTIPEAVQLVLIAAAMGEGGETFLLRMGEPVRILDLARNMIELSGLKPDEDIKIIFTGLRAGEKLHEELKGDREEALPTSNEKIMVLTGIDLLEQEGWRLLERLEEAALDGHPEHTLDLLAELVPDYRPGRTRVADAANTPKVTEIGPRRHLDAQA
jgi:FlaA1/EpsC-like NDP-sugar epimerase